MFGLPNEVVIIAGLLVLGLLMIMIVIAKMYRKVGPNEALIRYGMGGTEVYCGRGALIFPMVQTCRDLSLELMSFDVAPAAESVYQAGRGRDRRSRCAIKSEERQGIHPHGCRTVSYQAAGAARSLDSPGDGRPSPGNYRQLTVEQIVKEPEMVGDRMRSTCADDMSRWG